MVKDEMPCRSDFGFWLNFILSMIELIEKICRRPQVVYKSREVDDNSVFKIINKNAELTCIMKI